MPLVERLMGLNADGSEAPNGTPDQTKISVHDFFAACTLLAITGSPTVAQIKSFLNMDAATAAEFDLLIAQAPTGTTASNRADRALFIERLHATFLLAEGRYPIFDTPAEVRAALSLPPP